MGVVVAAAAVLTMLVVMLMRVLVMAAAAVLPMLVVMLMRVLVMAAAAVFAMLMVMLMRVLVMAAAAVLPMLVVMLAVTANLFQHFFFHFIAVFHCLQQPVCFQLAPRRCNNRRFRVTLSQKRNGPLQTGIVHSVCA